MGQRGSSAKPLLTGMESDLDFTPVGSSGWSLEPQKEEPPEDQKVVFGTLPQYLIFDSSELH